jgi:hypothetical protein
MNCANHPEAPAIAYCRECGKPLCEACRRSADGTIYCEQHAPASAWGAAPPQPPPTSPYAAPVNPAPETTPYTTPAQPSGTLHSDLDHAVRNPGDPGASPGLAFMLGFIPGVGAIYNGQYVKGIVHVVIMGILIALVSSNDIGENVQPLFGMLIAAWVFYMAFEAYHTAKKRQLGLPVDEFSSIVPRRGQPSRFPVAPAFLIAVGLLFLLHNLNIIRIGELIHYWPVALICLGVYMLYERLSGPSHPEDRGTPDARETVNERH